MEEQKRIPQLALIFAKDVNNVIGKNNAIPFRSPHDLIWFRFHTVGHNVIMGRKTWESLPEGTKPLPGRTNYVISRDPCYCTGQEIDAPDRAIVKTSLQAAVDDAQRNNENGLIFVIGGKALLEEAAKIASRAYVSRIGVNTPIDESCVMAPELPDHFIVETHVLFGGNQQHPYAVAEIIDFIQ
jgi:dihydrofolate reductase